MLGSQNLVSTDFKQPLLNAFFELFPFLPYKCRAKQQESLWSRTQAAGGKTLFTRFDNVQDFRTTLGGDFFSESVCSKGRALYRKIAI